MHLVSFLLLRYVLCTPTVGITVPIYGRHLPTHLPIRYIVLPFSFFSYWTLIFHSIFFHMVVVRKQFSCPNLSIVGRKSPLLQSPSKSRILRLLWTLTFNPSNITIIFLLALVIIWERKNPNPSPPLSRFILIANQTSLFPRLLQ